MPKITSERRLVELTRFLRTANLYALQSTQINRGIALAEETYHEIYSYVWAESYYCFLLCAAKLFDSSRGSLSVEKLLFNVEVTKYEQDKERLLEEFAKIKKLHQPVITRVIKIRNEAIAHIDIMLAEANSEHELEMTEVEGLLIATMQFLDSLPWNPDEPYQYSGSYTVQKIFGLQPKKELIQNMLQDFKAKGILQKKQSKIKPYEKRTSQ